MTDPLFTTFIEWANKTKLDRHFIDSYHHENFGKLFRKYCKEDKDTGRSVHSSVTNIEIMLQDHCHSNHALHPPMEFPIHFESG